MASNVIYVNLDALLPREDLAVETHQSGDLQGLKVTDLGPTMQYGFLRKPDFQRETANWTPEQVADLVCSFVQGDLIPSLILWLSGSRAFVIDGAHRLSALAAWVRDDFGDGELSRKFFRNKIPILQTKAAETARSLVHERVGKFVNYNMAGQFPDSVDEKTRQSAAALAFRDIPIQWIKNATVDQARDAFFRINKGGTKIDPTEIKILKSGASGVALASRAIARAGTGHNYWHKFTDENREKVEVIAKEIYAILYAPPFELPLKTLDVPLAGFGYGAHVLPFCFDLVVNSNADPLSVVKTTSKSELLADNDGALTLTYLKSVLRDVRLICSNDPSSLGLHPALYFYTSSGHFQDVAFFNIMAWIKSLEKRKKLSKFLSMRGEFEKLALRHPSTIKPAIHKLGSGARSRPRMLSLYDKILDDLLAGNTIETIWQSLGSDPNFKFVVLDEDNAILENSKGSQGKKFKADAKSNGFLRETLSSAPRCPLCGGLRHCNGINTDHTTPKDFGGTSAPINAQPTHPRCNSEKGNTLSQG